MYTDKQHTDTMQRPYIHFSMSNYWQATIMCNDMKYWLTVFQLDPLPCCPPGFPICCGPPSDKCVYALGLDETYPSLTTEFLPKLAGCATGSFCVGVETCCPNGDTGCGEGMRSFVSSFF
jgi:hypothetical protein